MTERRTEIVIDLGSKPGEPVRETRFGNVTVRGGTAPDPDRVAAEAAETARRLERALRSLIEKPGVKLEEKPGVPYFSCDPDNPDILVRRLDGRTEKGRMVEGSFVPLAAPKRKGPAPHP